jgi:hypothetical protein
VYAAPGTASLGREEAARAVWLPCRCGGAPQVRRHAWRLVWSACSPDSMALYQVKHLQSSCRLSRRLHADSRSATPWRAVPHSISTWAIRWPSCRLERTCTLVACAQVATERDMYATSTPT